MSIRWIIMRAGLGLSIVACAAAIAGVLYVYGGLDRALRLARYGLWGQVQGELRFYLWLYPNDSQAHFLIAEALFKAQDPATHENVRESIAHLQCIPLESELAVRALTQQAWLHLTLLDEPSQAEDSLTEALSIDPCSADAHLLKWKLYDLTGRSFLAEPHFWQVYEHATEVERPIRLREWFMSQLFPAMANPGLDQLMGFRNSSKSSTETLEADRLVRFRQAEPHQPLAHAALARWFLIQGDPQYARQLLDQAHACAGDQPDAFVVATSVSVYVTLGQLEEAQNWMDRWPGSKDGYEYWLWSGVLYEQRSRDYALAAQAYEQAVGVWPGVIDWRTHHRLVNCLTRIGEQKRASDARELAKRIESLSTNDVLDRIRSSLKSLSDPGTVKLLVDYYEQLGREREAQCWREYGERLPLSPEAVRDPRNS